MVQLSHETDKVHITDPQLPFGSIHTESLYPVFQSDGVYQINQQQHLTTSSGSGGVALNDSALSVSTGTTIYSYGTLQSRKRLRYRAGQGVVARFTAKFTTPVENSYQVIGIGHAEDGIFVGFNGTRFGILHSSRGVRECQTLTITTKSSTVENVTVTLNGVAFSVAVTNGASTVTTAHEIASGTFTGWKAEAEGSTVRFVSDSVGNKTGAFTLAGTTVVGAFAETKAGVAATDVWIYKEDFNGNNLNSQGSANFIFDPTKFNVFQIGLQYLGAGQIYVDMEMTDGEGHTDWERVHTIRPANTRTNSTFSNPAFPFTMSAYSAGSTTNLTIECASYAGFIEGNKKLHGPRITYFGQSTTVTALAYIPIFSIRNNRFYSSKASQAVINFLSISGAVKHTQPVTIYLVKNATLTGPTNWAQYSTTSCASYDSTSTGMTISDNDQFIWAGQLGETGDMDHHFVNDEVTIQPGEIFTVCARASTGTPAYVLSSVNTREDQ